MKRLLRQQPHDQINIILRSLMSLETKKVLRRRLLTNVKLDQTCCAPKKWAKFWSENIQISRVILIKNVLKNRHQKESEITDADREKVASKQITTVICSPIFWTQQIYVMWCEFHAWALFRSLISKINLAQISHPTSRETFYLAQNHLFGFSTTVWNPLLEWKEWFFLVQQILYISKFCEQCTTHRRMHYFLADPSRQIRSAQWARYIPFFFCKSSPTFLVIFVILQMVTIYLTS